MRAFTATVFSKHLKFYSEYFFDTNKVVGKKDLAPTATPPAIKAIESASYKADGQNNLQMVFRFTNETFDNLLLQANFIQFAPKKAHIIGAQATYTYNVNYKIGLGARWIESNDKESPIERLKDSSLVYASLDYYFDTAK